MGEGVYGAECAAQRYFHKSAADLTREEAASIAAILPNPRERNPASPSPRVLERREWILKQMHNLGGVSYLE